MAHKDLDKLRSVSDPGEPAASPRVLLVDDDPLVLLAYRRTLRRYFDVETASGGQAALDLLERDRGFDVVLCDIVMPGVSGAQLADEVARRWPELDRRLIFWTAGITGGAALEDFAEREAHRVHHKAELDPRGVVEIIAACARDNARP